MLIPGEQGDYLELTTVFPEHFCLDVSDAQYTRRLLEERGIEAILAGPRQVTVTDPDGTRIELKQP